MCYNNKKYGVPLMSCTGCDARRIIMKQMAEKAKKSWDALISKYSEKTNTAKVEIENESKSEHGRAIIDSKSKDDGSDAEPEQINSDSDGSSKPTYPDPEPANESNSESPGSSNEPE